MRLKIVIPIYKKEGLERLFDSLNDQDYQDFEVLAVMNGLNKKRIKLPTLENGNLKKHIATKNGPQYARDLGIADAYVSGCEYVVFSDQDVCWMPGMIGKMVKRLDSHRDIDFVYGNYKFIENEQIFQARPFDEYALETMNYVSTMSMWRTEKIRHLPWRLDEKNMQDWGFAYRATKAGLKGLWVNDILFSTKLPTDSSISGQKGTLAEKAKLFRDKNEVSHKNLVVSTFGCPTQAMQRAKMLNADYCGVVAGTQYAWFPSQLQFPNWDATYMVGVFNEPVQTFQRHLDVCVGHKILHFVGTDVFQLMESHSWAELNRIKKRLEMDDITVLANSPALQSELISMGIMSDFVATPLYKPERFQVSPLPKRFTVAIYYSDTQNMNYFNTQDPTDNWGGKSNNYMLWEVCKAMPHVQFKWFGGDAKFKTGNVEFCGKIPEKDMPKFISGCSAFLQSTIHNSMPHTPIQFLLSGRNAITTVDMPHTYRLTQTDILDYTAAKNEVIDTVNKLYNKIPRTWICGTVKQEYAEYLSEGLFVKKIYNILDEVKNG